MMNPTISAPSWKDRQKSQFSKVQLPTMPWRSFKLLMPHRMRRRLRSKLRSRISPATSIASLQTSFSPKDTLRSLQSYRWSVYDFQYLLLAIIGIFSLCMIQSADPFGKTFVASALLLSLLLPITRQFFLPFLPIAAWLIFFYACQYVFCP
jgi:inositol phosphorylceramide synthase catalytic subunit